MSTEAADVLLIDEPAPLVRRLTLNRPEKRNALNDALRGALFLTGDSMTGDEAVRYGFANRAHPLAELDDAVVAMAGRVAKIPQDLLALNKRCAHRAMEAMGIRTGIRATAEIQAMGFHQRSSREYMGKFRDHGVRAALSERDRSFGDYREAAPTPSAPMPSAEA